MTEVNPGRPEAGQVAGFTSVPYVPLAAVSTTGEVDATKSKPLTNSSGYTWFQGGDIIVAKITPSLENGKIALVPNHLGPCVGSTEFHVLRPRARVSGEFLVRYLRRPWVRAELSARMTGTAGQKRVKERLLARVPVPVPPGPRQAQIVSAFHKVDEAEWLSEQLIRRVSEVTTAALFEPLTGRDGALPDGWSWGTLGQITERLQYGLTESASSDAGKGHRFIRITDLDRQGGLQPGGVFFNHLTPTRVAKYELHENDILFARTGVGSMGVSYQYRVSDGPAIFASYLIRAVIDPSLAHPAFVAAYLRSPAGVAAIRTAARGEGKPNLSAPRLRRVRIPIPPRDVQDRVAAIYETSLAFRAAGLRARDRAQTLRASLATAAFRGVA